jgi:hypothetical protein
VAAQRRCAHCKDKHEPADMIQVGLRLVCGQECRAAVNLKAFEKSIKTKRVEFNRETKRRKKAAQKRTGDGGHYEHLKTALHRYIKHHTRKGEPCYTCGKEQRHGDHGGAFHVGHCMPAKSVDPRRFMIEQLRIQCYSCNVPNSGRQAVFLERLAVENGADWVEWLRRDVNHPSLKEQFPEVEDIKAEAAKYRRLLKDFTALA